MKNAFTLLRSRGVAVKAAAGALVAAAASGAHADLPAWATGLGTTLTASVNDTNDLIGPIFVLALAAGVVYKLIRRFARQIG